ncbi:hypothetical protein NQ317_009352 [Molorchus minor]|uniref:Uncharacterized protein n=1 Tax=Molorchus minor TaxID=1323400 RepID=A0ABQ9JM39_9CUCU|nr:hypothetical protein NQ317_009352 [Molorchus minor]
MDSQDRDENELRRHIHANSIDRHAIRKLLQKVFVPCSCKGECPKHEVAFSIEQTVRALDVPEENISTLLCYLELHEKRYIEILSPAYTMCKVISYGGKEQIRRQPRNAPPLAMALAMHKERTRMTQTLWRLPWAGKKLNNQPKRSQLVSNFMIWALGCLLLEIFQMICS